MERFREGIPELRAPQAVKAQPPMVERWESGCSRGWNWRDAEILEGCKRLQR